MKKILIATDGSPRAEGAVRLGGRIASAFKAEVTLVGISEEASQQPALLEALAQAQTTLRQENQMEAAILTAQGDPVERIAALTAETPYILVVLGGARVGGHALKAYQLVRRVHSRVLVARQDATRFERILLCSGGSRHSERAVRFAGELAARMGAEITFFHVMARPPAVFEGAANEENPEVVVSSHSGLGRVIERQNGMLDALGVNHSVRLRYGFVLDELSKELEDTAYDLVVVGARMKGSGGFFMDDLTQAIFDSVDSSVLVVRTVVEPSGGWFGRVRRWLRQRTRRKPKG